VKLGCTSCGRYYGISEYADEISEEMWEEIARRPANRA